MNQEEQYRRCNKGDCPEYYHELEEEDSMCFFNGMTSRVYENDSCKYLLNLSPLEKDFRRKNRDFF